MWCIYRSGEENTRKTVELSATPIDRGAVPIHSRTSAKRGCGSRAAIRVHIMAWWQSFPPKVNLIMSHPDHLAPVRYIPWKTPHTHFCFYVPPRRNREKDTQHARLKPEQMPLGILFISVYRHFTQRSAVHALVGVTGITRPPQYNTVYIII